MAPPELLEHRGGRVGLEVAVLDQAIDPFDDRRAREARDRELLERSARADGRPLLAERHAARVTCIGAPHGSTCAM